MCFQLFIRLSTSAPTPSPALPLAPLVGEGNKQLVQLLTAGPVSIINRGAPGMVVERCELVNIIKMPRDVGTLHYVIIVAFVITVR